MVIFSYVIIFNLRNVFPFISIHCAIVILTIQNCNQGLNVYFVLHLILIGEL